MDNISKEFYIGSGDEKKLLAFNLNVMADIQKMYGSVDDWVELLEKKNEDGTPAEPDAEAFIKGFRCMLNEGVDIENEKDGGNRPELSERQVGRIITSLGQAEVHKAMANAIIDSTKTGDKPKNE